MKRLILILLTMILVLTACSGPVIPTSPSLRQETASPTQDSGLGHASDYAALIKLVRQAQANASQYPTRNYVADSAAKGGAVEAAASQTAVNGQADYSQTNIQVEGVDEADIIKTDGKYLYLVANNRLYIVDARDPAKMKVLSATQFISSQETDKITTGESPVEMYLDATHNRLTLIINGWLYEKIPVTTQTGMPETKSTAPTKTTTASPSTAEPSKPTSAQPNGTNETRPAPDQTVAPASVGPIASGTATTPASVPNGTAPAAATALDPAASAPAASTGTAGPAVTGQTSGGVSRSDAKVSAIMPYYQNNYKQYTTTRIYDLSDRSKPKMVRQFSQEGYYVSSRKIDGAVYVVTNQYKYQIMTETGKDPEPAAVFPQTRDSLAAISDKGWTTVAADKISILPNGNVSNQLVLSALDTLKDTAKPTVISVLGSTGTIYASTQYLYVAGYHYQWDGKQDSVPTTGTDIYRFKLAGAQISEAGKGSVNGYLLNQFSMDEYQGFFRIATTSQDRTGKTATVNNNVYVLDGSLKMVGSVEGLAPGETIKSVRFIGGQVYVVTFRNVDPLFVIDLSQPSAPKVLGQLKIPGYSTYLHPYAANKLLGFGYDVKSEGNNAYNMGLKVSLFDIADFNNPKELSTILLGGRGSSAEILYNHKTLLFSLEKNLIAFPATLTKTITNNPLEYGQPAFQGLLVLAVDAGNQLTLRGSITHFDKLNDPNGKPVSLNADETQAFYGYDAISRGAWIGNILYTFSARRIRSAQLDTLNRIGEIELPGYEDYQKTYAAGGVAQGAMVK